MKSELVEDLTILGFRIRDFMLNNIDIYTGSNISNTDTNRSKL